MVSSQARSSLEYGTKLVSPKKGGWSFSLYPEAAEGGGSFRSASADGSPGATYDPDPDRNASDAARRARTRVRRYCAANRLNRLGTLTYAGRYWLSLGWSPEALGSDGDGTYTQVGARFPVNDAFRIEAAAGYYRLDEVYDRSYAHGLVSAIWAVKAPVELRLTAHATDSSAGTIFGDDAAGDRIEAAVQASF